MGIRGCWRGLRGEALWPGACSGRVEASGVSMLLLGEFDWSEGSGTGKGETESAVTEADGWAL